MSVPQGDYGQDFGYVSPLPRSQPGHSERGQAPAQHGYDHATTPIREKRIIENNASDNPRFINKEIAFRALTQRDYTALRQSIEKDPYILNASRLNAPDGAPLLQSILYQLRHDPQNRSALCKLLEEMTDRYMGKYMDLGVTDQAGNT